MKTELIPTGRRVRDGTSGRKKKMRNKKKKKKKKPWGIQPSIVYFILTFRFAFSQSIVYPFSLLHASLPEPARSRRQKSKTASLLGRHSPSSTLSLFSFLSLPTPDARRPTPPSPGFSPLKTVRRRRRSAARCLFCNPVHPSQPPSIPWALAPPQFSPTRPLSPLFGTASLRHRLALNRSSPFSLQPPFLVPAPPPPGLRPSLRPSDQVCGRPTSFILRVTIDIFSPCSRRRRTRTSNDQDVTNDDDDDDDHQDDNHDKHKRRLLGTSSGALKQRPAYDTTISLRALVAFLLVRRFTPPLPPHHLHHENGNTPRPTEIQVRPRRRPVLASLLRTLASRCRAIFCWVSPRLLLCRCLRPSAVISLDLLIVSRRLLQWHPPVASSPPWQLLSVTVRSWAFSLLFPASSVILHIMHPAHGL
ncbi:hypothetical protein CDD80_2721 [Ophiocordyceps camponoti-rufipedis]|uniref:Uncharacterized protein n=1 Tax=Ophiocordyceps camponoti-rufipedis TaxID=2004952 RepID=A0A2C5XJV2_9HYPO|nr:hypothetical protein CDD80_2721 [Ophiocordyceps camponoti-rufipedis]